MYSHYPMDLSKPRNFMHTFMMFEIVFNLKRHWKYVRRNNQFLQMQILLIDFDNQE